MRITSEAEEKIKSVLTGNSHKFPRITLQKGGCAGTMLVLTLEEKNDTDKLMEISGIKFAVACEAVDFVDDISIEIKQGLTDELIVKKLNAHTCRCGKSFKI